MEFNCERASSSRDCKPPAPRPPSKPAKPGSVAVFGVEVAGVEAAAAGVEAFGSAAARLGIPAWSEISLKVRCSGRFAGFAGVLEVPTPGFLEGLGGFSHPFDLDQDFIVFFTTETRDAAFADFLGFQDGDAATHALDLANQHIEAFTFNQISRGCHLSFPSFRSLLSHRKLLCMKAPAVELYPG